MNRLTTMMLVCILFYLFQQTSRADTWKQIKRIVDGDTIVLVGGQKVRYIGINAPELAHDDHNAEPYGEASKQFNSLQVKEKKVRLEFDTERFDRYKRLLAYVFLKTGAFVNAKILINGYAYFLRYPPNLKYDSILLQSQQASMSAKRGIWQNWKENNNPVVGNKTSRRFHLRSCPYGKRIKPQNRIVFQKKWDAFWEGYAPAKKCQPVFDIPQNR
jgi:micrococcal nuclease